MCVLGFILIVTAGVRNGNSGILSSERGLVLEEKASVWKERLNSIAHYRTSLY